MDAKGRELEGAIDAENEARAIAQIKDKGLFPTTVSELNAKKPGSGAARRPAPAAAGRPAAKAPAKGGLQMELRMPKFLSGMFKGRVKSKHLTIFTRQLATLINAGLPLLRGLHVLQKQERQPALREAIASMAESVESGSTFAEAMAQHPKIFSGFFVNMVRAGEASGALHTVLERQADFMEKTQRIKNKVRGAMVYPIVVLVMAVAIMAVLMVFVIPKFKSIFEDLLQGQPLPKLTQMVIGVSTTLAHRGLYVLAALVGLGFLINFLAKTPFGKLTLDKAKLGAPIFGQLVRKTAIANFTRTLGTLLTGGVPILQALNIVTEITGNAVISRAVTQVHDSVKEGESMVTPLEASGAFPGMVVSMIQVGEETGALPEMLMKIAETYDDEVDTAVEALTSIIEPIMIILLAVVVGTIVIAMFMPLISIIGNMQ
jgi:type IV pilus assembly protein PilC